MNEQELKELLSPLISDVAWLIIVAVVVMSFKNAVGKLVEGLFFFFGDDYNVDDIVYIHGEKKAKIIRQGIFKTTFYIYKVNRNLTVPNTKLPTMMIEKVLPKKEEEE